MIPCCRDLKTLMIFGATSWSYTCRPLPITSVDHATFLLAQHSNSSQGHLYGMFLLHKYICKGWMCHIQETSYTLNAVNPKPLNCQCTDKIDFWLEKKSSSLSYYLHKAGCGMGSHTSHVILKCNATPFEQDQLMKKWDLLLTGISGFEVLSDLCQGSVIH
jgi:hypothetical protein